MYFTLIIIAIALISFFAWLHWGNFNTAILVLTSVLIVACPCALAMSLPFTLGSTMRIFGKKGLYIKNTSVIEKLTKIDTIVFDKTGTLTKPDENNIEFIGSQLSEQDIEFVATLARQSTHPLSNAVAKNYPVSERLEVDGFIEVSGRGIFGKIKNSSITMGSKEYVTHEIEGATSKASKVYLKINDEIRGYFTINNKYRDGFENVIGKLSKQFRIYLLSGDNDSERTILKKYFHEERICFNQQPHDKMEFIKSLQSQGKNVLMTGDGLNDAGAFMQSDVALSIADNIYHFSPAGDAIIDASKFSELYKFIRFSRQSMVIVKLSFAISFLYNIVGLTIAVTGNLSPVIAAILMPVSSITVVAFATFATQLVARRSL